MRISDWSSDVCSSDLVPAASEAKMSLMPQGSAQSAATSPPASASMSAAAMLLGWRVRIGVWWRIASFTRSEEHTSELQSLMRISYAVFCLKKKKDTKPDVDQYRTAGIHTTD